MSAYDGGRGARAVGGGPGAGGVTSTVGVDGGEKEVGRDGAEAKVRGRSARFDGALVDILTIRFGGKTVTFVGPAIMVTGRAWRDGSQYELARCRGAGVEWAAGKVAARVDTDGRGRGCSSLPFWGGEGGQTKSSGMSHGRKVEVVLKAGEGCGSSESMGIGEAQVLGDRLSCESDGENGDASEDAGRSTG